MRNRIYQHNLVMSLINTPYPHASVVTFTKVLGLISFSITFILIVLQPFGTSNFVHNYKLFLLSGYGGVIFISGSLTYILVNFSLSETIKDRWTIGQEVLMLFLIVLICQSACFFYWSWLFSPKISLNNYISFLMIASSVALLPIGFYLFYIYQRYKDVHHASNINLSSNNDAFSDTTTPAISNAKNKLCIVGTGKSEEYKIEADRLYVVKAEDNYVILYINKDDIIKKWMLRATMNEIERQLNSDFVRIHRSFIINKIHIENLSGNVTNTKVKIQKIDDDFSVSRTKVEQIRKLYEYTIK